MQRLVEDLLTLSALESEQNPLTDEPFAIVPLLLAACRPTRRALSQGQHASRRSTSATPRPCSGSRDELASAFGNLVSQCDPLHAGGRHDHARLAHRRTTVAACSR